jgi:hypothetical protein
LHPIYVQISLFKFVWFIPCLARREVLENLNFGINEETSTVAELSMHDDMVVYKVVVTNEADQTISVATLERTYQRERPPSWQEVLDAYIFTVMIIQGSWWTTMIMDSS